MTQPVSAQSNLNISQVEAEDLRKRIAILEHKWTLDIESGKNSVVHTGVQEGNQYRIANPAPLGLLAFGYTAMLFMGHNTRWTETGTNQLGYAFAIFLGGLTQLMAGMWEIYRNNMFGGTVFSFYGGLWLSYGLWGVLVGGTVLSAPHEYIKGLQMFIILWGIATMIFFFATLVISVTLQILFLSLAITLFLLAAGLSGNTNVTKAGGYFGIWTGAWAWYVAAAELLNSVYRRQVLPLGIVNMATKEPSLAGVQRPDTL